MIENDRTGKAFDTICSIRALNHWRRLFLPTYLGLRFILDSELGNSESKWLDAYVVRKILNRHQPRYTSFVEFKQQNKDGSHEYRTFHAASPTTALAESWFLAIIAADNYFRPHCSVHSYLWPRGGYSGVSYAHYMNGYSQRNKLVSSKLQGDQDLVAIILDIKNFYPSIDKSMVMERFDARLRKCNLGEVDRKVGRKIVGDFLSCTDGPKGIAVGPAIGHMMANLALENFDSIMWATHSSSYTRYVDDIVVVCPRNRSETIRDTVISKLQSEGFEPNIAKDDTLSTKLWVDNYPVPKNIRDVKFFEGFIFHLTSYLSYNGHSIPHIKQAFRDAGFMLPIDSIVSQAKYGRFRKFLDSNWKRIFAPQKYAVPRSPAEFVNVGKKIRDQLWSDLEILLKKEGSVSSITLKKWHNQRVRYIINRLLYLLPTTEYRELLALIAGLPEYFQATNVLLALATRDVNKIIEFPGATIRAFATLLNQFPNKDLKLTWNFEPSQPSINSVANMSLFGLLQPPDDWLAKCSVNDKELLRFCTASETDMRRFGDFSYYDEVRSLQLGRSTPDNLLTINTRYNTDELVWLDVLDLADDSYSG